MRDHLLGFPPVAGLGLARDTRPARTTPRRPSIEPSYEFWLDDLLGRHYSAQPVPKEDDAPKAEETKARPVGGWIRCTKAIPSTIPAFMAPMQVANKQGFLSINTGSLMNLQVYVAKHGSHNSIEWFGHPDQKRAGVWRKGKPTAPVGEWLLLRNRKTGHLGFRELTNNHVRSLALYPDCEWFDLTGTL